MNINSFAIKIIIAVVAGVIAGFIIDWLKRQNLKDNVIKLVR